MEMILIALTLGVRHGFDLDHLATIDALAKATSSNHIASKMSGFLFSLGHGLVVTLVSLLIGAGLMQSHIPEWLDGVGHWISIVFLVLFGLLNLYSVFQKKSSDMPVGIKSFLAKKIGNKKNSPFLILMVGALFAFSFDTFSQIALFSISASLPSGWIFSGILGISFTLGMMISDGLNGLFISSLIQRSGTASLILSRSLGLVIAVFSLTVGVFSLLALFK